MTDILTNTGIEAVATRLLLFFGAVIILITAFRVLAFFARMIPRPTEMVFFVLTLLVFGLFEIFRPMVIDIVFLMSEPVYESAISTDAQTAAFEAKLNRILSPSEFQIVQTVTKRTADSIGCNVADIYAVANCECDLNPYTIRTDGIAAGWIQFTTAGLGFVPGIRLSDVVTACRNRDAGKIMDWTHRYLTAAANGKKCTRPVDVYLLTFAPAYMGAADDKVMYSGWANPSYYLNKGIDGWAKSGDRIIRQEQLCDGRITVGELRLMMEYKSAKVK